LDTEIQQQREQVRQQLSQQVTELNAKISAWSSSSQEKKFVLARQSDLVARNVASPQMQNLADEQYATALHEKDAETARLAQKQIQLDGLNKGAYVGEELVGLATLAQKRRDIAFDAQRLAIEEAELSANIQDADRLLVAERDRLARLAVSEVAAPITGTIYSVEGSAGRHVNPGDSVATLVNCDEAFVVGIFSYRQAQNLAVGTQVQVASPDEQGPQMGTVREILPKTSDKSDDQFAIPFPQTERRELYVVVSLDGSRRSGAERSASRETAACGIGRWVTVTRLNGWLPSMSMMWSAAGRMVASAARNIFPASDASTSRAAGFQAASSAR
jgi:multidrug resistance efflux pump